MQSLHRISDKDIRLNSKMKSLPAVVVGVAIGAFGVGLAWAKAAPPAYMVVEYEITDRAGFEEFIKVDAKTHSQRLFLARHAKGVS